MAVTGGNFPARPRGYAGISFFPGKQAEEKEESAAPQGGYPEITERARPHGSGAVDDRGYEGCLEWLAKRSIGGPVWRGLFEVRPTFLVRSQGAEHAIDITQR